jgi:type VI secretion system protein ImpA
MSAPWEALLQPITAEEPCGPQPEGLPPRFVTLRLFGQLRSLEEPPEASHDPKSPVDNRKPPAWGEVKEDALAALVKAKDLRVLSYLGAAVLRIDGLGAFFETLKVASHWVESYWGQVHPPIDGDGVGLRSALNCFADRMAVVDRLRRLPLVESRQHGRFSWRDIDLATGQLPVGKDESKPDAKQIRAAFADMPIEELTRLEQDVADASRTLERIESKLQAERIPDLAPGFDPLSELLAGMNRFLREQVALRNGNAANVTKSGQTEIPPGPTVMPTDAAAAVSVPVGTIQSRADAIRALDAVAEFFRRNEPSSPIPLFIDRAKRLVSKDFLEVLADIAPDALGQARAAGGLKEGEGLKDGQ